jgi:hypothetical protein
MATGSITVHVTGGSGDYNYKVTGPVSPPTTSSNIITGLSTGYYTIYVKDLTTGCLKQQDSVFVPGSYSDPRFQLTKTDAGCAGNDGTISVMNAQYGRSPFIYTIIAPSPSGVGMTNATGNFAGLTAGEYSVQLQDSCGGIQVRRITIESYSWWFDTVSVVRNGCDSADVFIRLKDNKGNLNTSGLAFSGFHYGVVRAAGDTLWYSVNSFRTFLGNKRNLVLVAKDNCGNVHATTWFIPSTVKPSVGSVSFTNLACSTFTATVGSPKNLTNPLYCLYDNAGNQISCNTVGMFNNISYGSYCIKVTDGCYDTTISKCFTESHGIPSVATNVAISNQNCTSFTATVTGQTNLTTPSYCLYNSSNVISSCNNTGVFTNIPYGNWCIKIYDGCIDTIITRCFMVSKPVATLTSINITGANCNTFNVSTSGSNLINPYYCLYDSQGNVVTCDSSGVFTGIGHGSYCIKAVSCGDTTNSICFSSSKPVPAVAPNVQITNQNCTGFTASITGQTNLTSPQYCLYDNNNNQITCNTTGTFSNIPYGSYCIKITDGCYDTTINRCFTQLQAIPSVNATMQASNLTCSTLTITVTGTNLSNPQYCLYNSSNAQVMCNYTGVFDGIPYGQYCVTVHDGCIDTTFRICQTFTPVRGITLTTSKNCTIGMANISAQFSNNNSPYSVSVYNPDGSLYYLTSSSSNPINMIVPGLTAGAQYKIVGTDNCGNKDSSSIVPDASIVTKSTTVRSKCPSATWLNGAGDLMASSTSNLYSLIPAIIKKNGVAFNQSYSSYSSNVYTFSDLEPAQYIMEYTMQTCNSKIYDTVTIAPYAYPIQGQSAIYQCDNNGLSLGADVQGGVSPYSYQIIGSVPEIPSIATQPQLSPVFNINTGTVYSLVRLRSVDACGNATLSDVSVLPLQNISVAATSNCFYQNITLSVDTIPNANYQWYRKITPTDSTLLDSGLTYNLPFFVPEQTGLYVCKLTVNNGCLTRLSSFMLNGTCNTQFLPVHLQLKGRTIASGNQLYWTSTDEKDVSSYTIERRTAADGDYKAIGEIGVRNNGSYVFNDNRPASGINNYRLKINYLNKIEYSNAISLQLSKTKVIVYPNPAHEVLNITLTAETPTDYKVEIVGASGQIIYRNELKDVVTTTVTYTKDNHVQPGMYLLRVVNKETGKVEIYKILFE